MTLFYFNDAKQRLKVMNCFLTCQIAFWVYDLYGFSEVNTGLKICGVIANFDVIKRRHLNLIMLSNV